MVMQDVISSLQRLLEILSQRKDICKYAIVESVLVIPSKFTYSMIKPAFGSCYGLIKYKWVSKLQFKSLRIKPDLFDEYYKDKSLYFKGVSQSLCKPPN